MHFASGINRPPYETADGYLQTTEGCTHNSCSFCNMYQDIPFRMLPLNEVEDYLREVSQSYGRIGERIRRVYLVGADPLTLSAARLPERIDLIRKYLPNVQEVTMYARTDNIAAKTDEERKALKEAGVDDLYIGVECGLNDVLEKLNKGYSADETRLQCLRLNAVGIRHCDLLMLGTAGKDRGLACARATAALENEIKPSKILINTMSAFMGTKLDEEIRTGAFLPASKKENLKEEREIHPLAGHNDQPGRADTGLKRKAISAREAPGDAPFRSTPGAFRVYSQRFCSYEVAVPSDRSVPQRARGWGGLSELYQSEKGFMEKCFHSSL